MTGMYTIRAAASVTVDASIELDIEADSEAEAIQKFHESAPHEIEQLPFGHAEIDQVRCDGVPDDLIEVVSFEKYEDDDEPEEDGDE